jgi:hypothetical protein
MLTGTSEPCLRPEIIAMNECRPFRAYACSTKKNEADIEPDLPVRIAVSTEVTVKGLIEGPLWVTCNLPLQLSDRKPAETRNLASLYCCLQIEQEKLRIQNSRKK